MNLTREALQSAVEKNIISAEQANDLLAHFQNSPLVGPTFNFTNVLYYFGGLIAIGAMTLFMNLGWESFGGWGIFFISLAYAAVGLKLAGSFQLKGLAIPAGICATFTVALTPLAVYGLQQALGIWPDDSLYREYHRYIKWHWIYMEFATLIVGIIIGWRYKYPFLVMPIAVTLWYMSMDLAVMLMTEGYDFTFRALFSMYFGLAMIVVAFWTDIRSKSHLDFAFWLYIFGVLLFWGGMSAQSSDSELTKFIYFSINLLMIGIGVLLVRRVFVIFGAFGCCGYLVHLANNVFENSWLFPIALTAIGLLVIYLGILWQKNEQALTTKMRSYLPVALRELLEKRQ